MSEDRADIYICHTLEVLQLPLLMQSSAVNNYIPEESEIEMAVQGLKGGIAGDPSDMRAGGLKGWLREDIYKKDPYSRSWELVVRLVQVVFGNGHIT